MSFFDDFNFSKNYSENIKYKIVGFFLDSSQESKITDLISLKEFKEMFLLKNGYLLYFKKPYEIETLDSLYGNEVVFGYPECTVNALKTIESKSSDCGRKLSHFYYVQNDNLCSEDLSDVDFIELQ